MGWADVSVGAGCVGAVCFSVMGFAHRFLQSINPPAIPMCPTRSMATDKPIPAGTEVLHTYGDLSDSQLLQTYGFLDSEDDFKAGSGEAEAAAAAAKKRGRMTARQAAAAAAAAAAYRNPHNAALVPYSTVQQVCSGLLASMEQVSGG